MEILNNEPENEQEESEILTLTDENGQDVDFEYLDCMEYQGKEYLVLMPADEAETQIVILEVEPVDDENENYLAVEDEAVLRLFCNSALYTVLVEGDDMTEPIADETRSILDGHIVLSRKLAAANHYPAIDVQASVSRVMNAVVDKEHKAAAQALRKILAKYAEVELLVQIGEYKKGADAEADFALGHIQAVNAFLRQGLEEKSSFEETLAALKKVVL